MRRLFPSLASVSAILVTCGFALAQVPNSNGSRDVDADRVARLIKTLGSSSYDSRQTAGEELERLGSLTRSHLEAAVTDADPEIRLRARDLLQKLKVQDLWAPSRVTHQAQGEMASEILSALADQTGNRILVGDQYGKFEDGPVALDYVDAPFWVVMDALCHRSGNHVRPHYDTRNPGLVVVAGPPGNYPVAYAGPVRAEVTSARRVFIEELDYEHLGSETTHTFQLNFRLMWEDQFRLVAYRSGLQLVEATTDNGAQLSAAQSVGSGWNLASRGTRQLSMSLRLHPPPSSASRLDALRLSWSLIAVGDMATIDVDLSEPVPRTVIQDDLELTIEKLDLTKSKPGRYEVTVSVTRDRAVPQPRDVLYEENTLELLDAQGRTFRKQGQSNSLNDRGAKMKLSFSAPTAESKPQTLRFTYPRLRAQQDLEIAFDAVPLPVARPQ